MYVSLNSRSCEDILRINKTDKLWWSKKIETRAVRKNSRIDAMFSCQCPFALWIDSFTLPIHTKKNCWDVFFIVFAATIRITTSVYNLRVSNRFSILKIGTL